METYLRVNVLKKDRKDVEDFFEIWALQCESRDNKKRAKKVKLRQLQESVCKEIESSLLEMLDSEPICCDPKGAKNGWKFGSDGDGIIARHPKGLEFRVKIVPA